MTEGCRDNPKETMRAEGCRGDPEESGLAYIKPMVFREPGCIPVR